MSTQGYTEYMAMLLVNGSDPAVPMVPLQLNTTQASIASISSNKIGQSIVVSMFGLVMLAAGESRSGSAAQHEEHGQSNICTANQNMMCMQFNCFATCRLLLKL
jgi:hypothetical protein